MSDVLGSARWLEHYYVHSLVLVKQQGWCFWYSWCTLSQGIICSRCLPKTQNCTCLTWFQVHKSLCQIPLRNAERLNASTHHHASFNQGWFPFQQDVVYQEFVNKHANFENFTSAMITLFRYVALEEFWLPTTPHTEYKVSIHPSVPNQNHVLKLRFAKGTCMFRVLKSTQWSSTSFTGWSFKSMFSASNKFP